VLVRLLRLRHSSGGSESKPLLPTVATVLGGSSADANRRRCVTRIWVCIKHGPAHTCPHHANATSCALLAGSRACVCDTTHRERGARALEERLEMKKVADAPAPLVSAAAAAAAAAASTLPEVPPPGGSTTAITGQQVA
jgi:hypothetical protein